MHGKADAAGRGMPAIKSQRLLRETKGRKQALRKTRTEKEKILETLRVPRIGGDYWTRTSDLLRVKQAL